MSVYDNYTINSEITINTLNVNMFICTNSMVNSYHLLMKIGIVFGLLWQCVQNELSSLIIHRGSLVFISPKTFFAILLFNILTLRVVDDCYFRNAPWAFN